MIETHRYSYGVCENQRRIALFPYVTGIYRACKALPVFLHAVFAKETDAEA